MLLKNVNIASDEQRYLFQPDQLQRDEESNSSTSARPQWSKLLDRRHRHQRQDTETRWLTHALRWRVTRHKPATQMPDKEVTSSPAQRSDR